MPRKRTLLSWSGGKDCAWALHVLRNDARFAEQFEVVGLITTFNETTDPPRVAMHAVRLEVLRAQAYLVGLPVWRVDLPSPCSNEEYQARMKALQRMARDKGIEAIAYGDLHLKDVRKYREDNHADSGLQPLFPIWHNVPADASRETTRQVSRDLALTMLAAHVNAVLCTVDPKQLPPGLVGRHYNLSLLQDKEYPPTADWCGENGEFHTLALNGPAFIKGPLDVSIEQKVEKGGFCFIELQLKDPSMPLAAVDVHLDASSLSPRDWEGLSPTSLCPVPEPSKNE